MVLCCEVSSASVPVTWKKDGATVEEGGRCILKKKGPTHTLEIKKLCAEDAGEYWCISRGKKTTAKLVVRGRWRLMFAGVSTEHFWLVTLNNNKPAGHCHHSSLKTAVSSTERVRIVKELQDKTVTADGDAEFLCELSHADVSEGVWWLGSSPLQHNEMNQMTCRGRQHRLVLSMTTPEETGTVAFVVGEEKSSASLLVIPKAKGQQKYRGEWSDRRIISVMFSSKQFPTLFFKFQFYSRRSRKMLSSWKGRQRLCPARSLISPPQSPGDATTFRSRTVRSMSCVSRGKSTCCLSMMWILWTLVHTPVILEMHRVVPSLLSQVDTCFLEQLFN